MAKKYKNYNVNANIEGNLKLQKTGANTDDNYEVLVVNKETKEVETAEIVGGGGGGEGTIEKTKTEIDTLITDKELVVGAMYLVKGVDVPLYGGTDIYLHALTEDTLGSNGVGVFYNPKYDQSIAGYGIWSDSETYAVNDTVIWGGKHWKNLNGNVGASTDALTLDSEWSVIPFDDVSYNVAIDEIKYDYQNDMILYRNEGNSNVVDFNTITPLLFGNKNPIKLFQWGNPFSLNDNRGTFGIVVTNSLFYLLNSKGTVYNVTLDNNSAIQNLTLDNDSAIQNLTLDNNSGIWNTTLDNGSRIENTTLDNGSGIENTTLDNNSAIQNLTLDNNSAIQNTTLDNSAIQNLTLDNDSRIWNTTLDNSAIQNLTLDNDSAIQNLTSTLGFYFQKIKLDNYILDRTGVPVTGTEENKYFTNYITQP